MATKSTETITIIGGKGAMGQLFTKLWSKLNFNIQIIDQNDWDIAPLILKQTDLAVITVPINITIDIINKVIPLLPKHAILADFTSIKKAVIEHMISLHPGPILSLHPMFGPTVSSPDSQVIINCGGQLEDNSKWVISSLKQIGFKIVKMNATEHDEIMNFIQGIEHFSTFALGAFLKNNNLHPTKLFNIASPIYQAKLALLGRIFDQDAKLYADIIMADKDRLNTIHQYIDFLKEWINKLESNKREEFIAEFENIKDWMGEFTHQSQLASDHFLTEISNVTQIDS